MHEEKEQLEDTKGAINDPKSEKDRKYNVQNKMDNSTNNDLQNTES